MPPSTACPVHALRSYHGIIAYARPSAPLTLHQAAARTALELGARSRPRAAAGAHTLRRLFALQHAACISAVACCHVKRGLAKQIGEAGVGTLRKECRGCLMHRKITHLDKRCNCCCRE